MAILLIYIFICRILETNIFQNILLLAGCSGQTFSRISFVIFCVIRIFFKVYVTLKWTYWMTKPDKLLWHLIALTDYRIPGLFLLSLCFRRDFEWLRIALCSLLLHVWLLKFIYNFSTTHRWYTNIAALIKCYLCSPVQLMTRSQIAWRKYEINYELNVLTSKVLFFFKERKISLKSAWKYFFEARIILYSVVTFCEFEKHPKWACNVVRTNLYVWLESRKTKISKY